MKVLFVSSGTRGKISSIVQNQGESLKRNGIEVDYFIIPDKGFKGYIKSIPKIRKAYYSGNYDLVHAHYSLSAIASSCSGLFPLVISLMGSDAYTSVFWRFVIQVFHRIRWKKTIVKSQKMQILLHLKKAIVIPNGVDLEKFKPILKADAQHDVGFDSSKKTILFISNPEREEKNYPLAVEAIRLLKRTDVELKPIFNIRNEDISRYLNAADMLLLTSKREGSPNVIKEAMACNVPIVSTDVGDVKINLEGVDNCFVCKDSAWEIALKIEEVLKTDRQTNGRDKIRALDLDSDSIAKKIVSIYTHCLND